MQHVFSVMAGVLSVIGFVPYLWEVWRDRKLPSGHPDKAEPSKATWVIWASLDFITISGMYLEHSVNGQIVGATAGSWIVTLFAFKYGKPGWTTFDILCLGGALVGVSLMFFNPAWALVASLSSVTVGSIPTFQAASKEPAKESKVAWTIWELSCFCAIYAVPKWTVEDAAQPITFLLVVTVMMWLLFVRPLIISQNGSTIKETSHV